MVNDIQKSKTELVELFNNKITQITNTIINVVHYIIIPLDKIQVPLDYKSQYQRNLN